MERNVLSLTFQASHQSSFCCLNSHSCLISCPIFFCCLLQQTYTHTTDNSLIGCACLTRVEMLKGIKSVANQLNLYCSQGHPNIAMLPRLPVLLLINTTLWCTSSQCKIQAEICIFYLLPSLSALCCSCGWKQQSLSQPPQFASSPQLYLIFAVLLYLAPLLLLHKSRLNWLSFLSLLPVLQ